MLKQRNEQIQTAVRMADAIVCAVSFFAAYALRNSPLLAAYGTIGGLESVLWILAASLLIHLAIYPFLGFYTSLRLKSIGDIILMVIQAALVEVFVLGALVFFFKEKETSRYFFALFLAFNYFLVLAEKLGGRILLSSIRRRGYNYRQVLIVGTGASALRVIQTLRRNSHWGYLPFGLLREPGGAAETTELAGLRVWGALSSLEQVTQAHATDEVFFAMDRIDPTEISASIALCERLGIPARFSFPVLDLPNSKLIYSEVDNIPVLTVYRTLRTPWEEFTKRTVDVSAALIGLIVTAVLYPWISWRIQRESPGSVIFKQPRVGENGRTFKCYKFRTMYADAELRKKDLAEKNLMQGPLFKVENDPRVTRFGAFLRRTSLDELPQFFNILRGDMSLVGTRPPTPDEVRQYETHFRRRLSIRPGLTGLWQVSGRNEIRNFEDVLKLDLEYIDRWSIWLDFEIVFRTVWMLITRRGAF